MPTVDYTYPIGAFGRTVTDNAARDTGVVFARYDTTKRYNGYQTIFFSGMSTQIANARKFLDNAVVRHLRRRENQRQDNQKQKQMSDNMSALLRRGSPPAPTRYGNQGRFACLEVDGSMPAPPTPIEASGKKLTKRERQSQNHSAKNGSSVDVTGLQRGLIDTSKHNAWVDRCERQKALDSAIKARRDAEIARYTSITGNVPANTEITQALEFIAEYDRVDKDHLDDDEVDEIEKEIELEAFQAEGEELETLTEMQLVIGTTDGGLDVKAPLKAPRDQSAYDDVNHVWYQSDEDEEPPSTAADIIESCYEEDGYDPRFGTPCYTCFDDEPVDATPVGNGNRAVGIVMPPGARTDRVVPERPSYTAPPEAHFRYNAAMCYAESMNRLLA